MSILEALAPALLIILPIGAGIVVAWVLGAFRWRDEI